MDSLQGIKVYCAVVEGGSFAAAAAKLKISRAMVSKHVMQLEDRLQTRLLHRTTRSLSLTEAGAEFHERASQVLADLEAAEQLARSSTSEPRGTLRINAPTTFATKHIATHIAEFLTLYPELNVDISLSDRFVDPIEEGYDLTIRITTKLPESTLIARALAPCKMVVCASPAYFAANGEPQTPDDLARHNCLSYSMSAMEDKWDFVGPYGRRYVVTVAGRVRSNSGDLLRTAIVSGSGVMLLPSFIVGEDIKAGRLKAVLLNYQAVERTIYAVYPSRKHLSAKVRALVEFLETKYGKKPYWDGWLDAYAPAEVSS
jgi:DNA-binding transcriptional LysR family regulator